MSTQYPSSDIDTGTYWATAPFWSKLVDGDGTYVVGVFSYQLTDAFEVGLDGTTLPELVNSVSYRIALSTLAKLRVSLMDGDTEIAYWSHTGGGLVTYTKTLTQEQIDAITDLSDLRFKFTGIGLSLSVQSAYVYWATLELTEAGTEYFCKLAGPDSCYVALQGPDC